MTERIVSLLPIILVVSLLIFQPVVTATHSVSDEGSPQQNSSEIALEVDVNTMVNGEYEANEVEVDVNPVNQSRYEQSIECEFGSIDGCRDFILPGPGEYVIRVEDRYSTHSVVRTVQIASSREISIDIDLPPLVVIEVVEDDGYFTDELSNHPVIIDGPQTRRQLQTDFQGEVILTDVPSGQYNISTQLNGSTDFENIKYTRDERIEVSLNIYTGPREISTLRVRQTLNSTETDLAVNATGQGIERVELQVYRGGEWLEVASETCIDDSECLLESNIEFGNLLYRGVAIAGNNSKRTAPLDISNATVATPQTNEGTGPSDGFPVATGVAILVILITIGGGFGIFLYKNETDKDVTEDTMRGRDGNGDSSGNPSPESLNHGSRTQNNPDRVAELREKVESNPEAVTDDEIKELVDFLDNE